MSQDTASLASLEVFTIPGLLHFEADEHGMIRAQVTSQKCRATVYLHGAHVTHWQPSGAKPVLFLSRCAEFAPGRAIRGGVPIIFPWFGADAEDANAPAHGWARLSEWQVESAREVDGDIELVFRLDAEDSAAKNWETHGHSTLRYRVRAGTTLCLELEAENRGAQPILFEEALHTYFAVGDIHQTAVAGLGGASYIDKLDGGAEKVEPDAPLRIEGETDRIYREAAPALMIHDSANQRYIYIEKESSGSTVLWNPWIAKAAAMADFGDEEWTSMLCIETANIGKNKVMLLPREKLTMATRLRVGS